MVTEAESDATGAASVEAVTVTTLGVGGTPGAVKRPVALMVPTVALPPAMPSTDQVTALFVVPLTEAVNCTVWLITGEAVEGEMITEGTGNRPGAPPPHPDKKSPARATPATKYAIREALRTPHNIPPCIHLNPMIFGSVCRQRIKLHPSIFFGRTSRRH